MKTIMNVKDLSSIEEIAEFLAGTRRVAFEILADKDSRYRWVQAALVKFRYLSLGKRDRGTLIRYLMKVTGYSRQQVTRLVKQYRDTGKVERHWRRPKGFARRYSDADIRRLARMDERHGTPNGMALKKLCERAYHVFGEHGYERLASISVSHLYNLRKSTTYLRRRHHLEKTRPKVSGIGERRKPQPDGKPGHIRVDTVHQGDWDGRKGLYHINAVDEITQWELILSVEKINENHLLPVLDELLAGFPFPILGFHSDNGSEFINKQVAKMLEKLRAEFTKSRARQSNDNALVECKNGHVVRKAFGHDHIPRLWASAANDFNRMFLNPFINYHRPCLFPKTITDDKGKQRKRYPYELVATPYEKLQSLPDAEKYLKPSLTFDILDRIALRQSDNQAADELQKARQQLFKSIHERERESA